MVYDAVRHADAIREAVRDGRMAPLSDKEAARDWTGCRRCDPTRFFLWRKDAVFHSGWRHRDQFAREDDEYERTGEDVRGRGIAAPTTRSTWIG